MGEGFAATYPFVEGFEIDIRPMTGGVVRTLVHDGQARVETAVSCTSDQFPTRSVLRATRDGADQMQFAVFVQCSATQPTDR